MFKFLPKNVASHVAPILLMTAASSFGAALIITPPTGTSQVTITGSVPTSQVDNLFVYHFTDANGTVNEGALSISNIPFGLPLSATFSLPASVTSGYATFVGLYNLASSCCVTVALNSTAGASAVGTAFESVFSGTTETALAAAILGQATVSGSNTTAILAFLNANSTLFPQFNGLAGGVSVSNVKFTNGVADGSLTVSILSGPAPSSTPEPATFLLAAPALGLLMIRRRRS